MDFNSTLSDISNINLVILGISITIFTVVYSFIVNKKQELKELTAKINITGGSPKESQIQHFILKYIRRYTELNKEFIRISIFSFTIFLASFSHNRFFFTATSKFSKNVSWILVLLTIILIAYFMFIFIKVVKQYNKDSLT